MKRIAQISGVIIIFLLLVGSLILSTTLKTATRPLYAVHDSLSLASEPLELPPHSLLTTVSFSTTGSGFAVPAIDERLIYVGSGFAQNCQNTGEIRAFDKETLALIWQTKVAGAIGDTTIILVDGLLIFGAGDGIAALHATDGSLAWQLHLTGCFQESFIRLHNDRLYTGSSSGDIYAISTMGQTIWQNHLPGAVFARPAVFSNTLFFVDLTNTLTTVALETGQIVWQKVLPVDAGKTVGIFAGPLVYDNSLFVATYAGDVWRLSLQGEIEARHSTEARYLASLNFCNEMIIAANLDGRVDWLEVKNLQPSQTVTVPGVFLFGTPQCVNDIVVVTTYGAAAKPSNLYYLQSGQILRQVGFPCCKHALTTTVIDADHIYNVLTTYDSSNLVDLVRSAFVPYSYSQIYLPSLVKSD